MIVLEQLITRKKTPYTLPELDLEIKDRVLDINRDACCVKVAIHHARTSESVFTYGVVVSNTELMGSRLVFPTNMVDPFSKGRKDVIMEAVSLVVPAHRVETITTPVIKCLSVNEFLKVIQTTEENCKRFGNEPEFVRTMPLVAAIYSPDGSSKSWFITRVEYDRSEQILLLVCDLIDDAKTDAYRLLKGFNSSALRSVDAELGI
jgi:hypothetical protein